MTAHEDDAHHLAGHRRVVDARCAMDLRSVVSRREFMSLMRLGGVLILLPGALISCQDGENVAGITAPGSGNRVVIDFSRGDVAVLQFAYALEQLEADFYTQVASSFASSNFTIAEQAILADIRNHEIVHREFLRAALGTDAGFSLTPVYPGLNFRDRAAVLDAARTFEDLGVAAYNGVAQFLADAGNLLVASKIVSVEARHAAAIRALINPRSGDFAPGPFDDAFRPPVVAAKAGSFLVEKVSLAGVPDSFVQGPNGNG